LLGTRILDKAWQGLNVTMFAYGQTGSGKSYTMFGYGANQGVVPMAADRIFAKIAENKDPNVEFKVSVHMVEIYMEKINDLLIEKKDRGEPLKIREKAGDVYVEGVANKAVSNYDQIKNWIEFGDKNRAIDETAMNKTSSRSHTVFTLELIKVTTFQGKKSQVTSEINLVDLAGSEKQSQAKTSGDRLAEGNAINLSLSALGNVITALAKKSNGDSKVLIPYRDSALTRML
jgi:hypothetical protein